MYDVPSFSEWPYIILGKNSSIHVSKVEFLFRSEGSICRIHRRRRGGGRGLQPPI